MKPQQPTLRLKTWTAVPESTRAAVRELIAKLPQFVDIRHEVLVYLEPSAFWLHGDTFCEGQRKLCTVYGLFHEPNAGYPPIIRVAGLAFDCKSGEWLDGEQALRHVRLVILHEAIHYTQYRDGRKQTERGVDKAARELYAAMGYE